MSERDPGDAVPPGVAPVEPVPLTEEDERVRERLEHLRDRVADEEVERITQTVEPGSAAPSRAGISGSGSGADGEGL